MAAAGTADRLAADEPARTWWTTSDEHFYKAHGKKAFGSPKERSQFAWMLFARVNQPAKTEDGQKFVAWELWSTNAETFPESGQPTWPKKKHRKAHDFVTTTKAGARDAEKGGEEVTRNRLAYDYIVAPQRPLWSVKNLNAVYADQARIEFPIGAIEVKANWTTATGTTDWGASAPLQSDMYQSIDGTGLNGLHVMVKVLPTPAEPFTSPNPSWFWTTFEYHGNPGRDDAMKFVTYPDVLTPDEVAKLLEPTGIPATLAKSYRCNGTQSTFLTEDGKPVILGNTTMEGQFGSPTSDSPLAPAKWTNWNSSCHTCHGLAAMNAPTSAKSPPRFGFPKPGVIGELPSSLTEGMLSTDFVWAVPDRAVPRPPPAPAKKP